MKDGECHRKKVGRAPAQIRRFSLGHKEVLFTVVFELNQEDGYSIKNLCEAMSISRSGYYKWRRACEIGNISGIRLNGQYKESKAHNANYGNIL